MANFLEFSSLDDQFLKGFAQCAGDGVGRVQIWCPFTPFQKPDVGLVESSQLGQGCPAQAAFLAVLFHHPRERI